MSTSDKTSLGDRMKEYENACSLFLTKRMPLIVRVDGKSFHSYTKGLKKPWDLNVIEVMNETANELCRQIQGAQLAYIQSDEISVLIHNYHSIETQAFFDNKVQKIASITAAIAAAYFTANSWKIWSKPDYSTIKPAVFDSRVFAVPEDDVSNYFLWRQRDAERNSVQTLGRVHYSNKELFKKNGVEIQEMLHAKGVNWNDVPTSDKRGRCVVKKDVLVGMRLVAGCSEPNPRKQWTVDNEIPKFSTEEGRNYINRFFVKESDGA